MSELQFITLRRDRRLKNASALLRLERLTVKVGIRRVIGDLSLDVFEGDAIRVAGANGSGKSTLLNAIAGLEPARIEAGRIFLAGEDVTKLAPHERAHRGIAIMRQRDNVFIDLTVNENLQLAIGVEGRALFRRSYPQWAAGLGGRKRVGLLSGGQKQRLAWAMATLRPSRLLLADEPCSYLSTMRILVEIGS